MHEGYFLGFTSEVKGSQTFEYLTNGNFVVGFCVLGGEFRYCSGKVLMKLQWYFSWYPYILYLGTCS